MSKERIATAQEKLEVWKKLSLLQNLFPETEDGLISFAEYIIKKIIPSEPDLTRIQKDILKFLFNRDDNYKGVAAQRGQAKSTMCCIYSIFCLIHKPNLRILIVSAGTKLSRSIANFLIQLLNTIDILEPLRARISDGDRSSSECYDVNWILKGPIMSPSIACLGVTSHMQGYRADLLIADDIESLSNSRTFESRQLLEDLTKEFESITGDGKIIYLFTPQSVNSIYNNLPGRGYNLRFWPGRYPKLDELSHYNNMIAPLIQNDIDENPDLCTGGGLNKDLGQPTDPEMFNEYILTKKELSLGINKFYLQVMVDCTLNDQEKYPLKLDKLIVTDFDSHGAPINFDNLSFNKFVVGDNSYRLFDTNYLEKKPFTEKIMAIDPSGGGANGDATACVTIGYIGSIIYIIDTKIFPGGYDPNILKNIVLFAKENKVNRIFIEKNFGNGALTAALRPYFVDMFPVTIEEVYNTKQKELRIIDNIEPVLSTDRLIVSKQCIENDYRNILKYPINIRSSYSLFNQFKLITREKNSLRHDDSIDALGTVIEMIVDKLDFDTVKYFNEKQKKEYVDTIKSWNSVVDRRRLLGVDYSKPKRKSRFD